VPMLEDPSLGGLLVAQKNAVVTSNDGIFNGLCEVWLNLAQNPPLLIQFSAQIHRGIPDANSDSLDGIEILFDGTIRPILCTVYGQRIGSSGNVTTHLRPNSGVFLGRDNAIRKARVLLANFGDYHFKPQGLSFKDEIFQWILTPLSEEERKRFEPCETRDFHITHSALLQRKDEKDIGRDEVEKQVENLRLFLSFCQGGWVSPVCVQGLGKNDEQIFEHWRDSLLSHYQSHSRSWLDSFDGAAIADVWPEFISKCHDPLWKESIKLSFYWLLRGDSGQVGSDGGLILLQAAFERIAWHILVIDKKELSAEKFKKTQAAKKLRMLLVRMKIPCEVPNTSPKLVEFARDNDGLDGPETLTRLRNALVHPRSSSFSKRLPYPQAYFLARHYLLLCLLGLFNYKGNYIVWTKLPRWVGEVERVPWV